MVLLAFCARAKKTRARDRTTYRPLGKARRIVLRHNSQYVIGDARANKNYSMKVRLRSNRLGLEPLTADIMEMGVPHFTDEFVNFCAFE